MKTSISGRIPSFSIDDCRSTVAVFSSLMATAIGCWYYVFRLGLKANDPWPVLKVLSLAYFVLCWPLVGHFLMRRKYSHCVQSPCCSANAQCLSAMVLAAVAGFASPHTTSNVGSILCAAGFLLFVATFLMWVSAASWKKTVVFLCSTGLFGLWAGAAIFGGYCDPLFLESLVVGRTHLDQLFLTAATSITTTYGVPSTGLDGVALCPYHWGSWWLLAQFSKLLGTDAITISNLGYPVIVIPLILNSLMLFALDVRQRLCMVPTGPLRANFLFWVFFFVAVIGFMPREVSFFLALGLPAAPSLGLSLALAFMIMSVVLSLADTLISETISGRFHDWILLIFIIPLLLFALTLTKLSTGFMVGIVFGYLFLRLKLYKRPLFVASIIACAVAVILGLRHTVVPGHVGLQKSFLYPFHYLTNFVNSEWRSWFFLLHFSWSWLFLVSATYARGIGSLRDFREAFRANYTIDMEVVALLCLAGAAPGLILAIDAGNAEFFSLIQSWAAVSLLLANIDVFKEKIFQNIVKPTRLGSTFWDIRVRALFAAALILFLSAAVLHRAMYDCAYAVYKNLSIRLCLCNKLTVQSFKEIGCEGKTWVADVKRKLQGALRGDKNESAWRIFSQSVLPLFTGVQVGLEHAGHYPMMKCLQELAAARSEDKRNTLVFIPQSNKAYWEMIAPDLIMALDYRGCKAVPFISPAVTGIASLDGMPRKGCDIRGFGYFAFSPRPRDQTENDLRRDSLCARAVSKGFDRLIVIDSDENGEIKLTRVSCRDVIAPQTEP